MGKRRRTGFTVLELLVVIACVAILLALLLPALRGALAVADDVACRNSLRGLGQAVQVYTMDDMWHRLPPGDDGAGKSFYDYVLPYAKEAATAALMSEKLSCPNASKKRYAFKMNDQATNKTGAAPYSGKREYMLPSHLALVILFEGVPDNGAFTDGGQKESAIQPRHIKNTRGNVFYWGGQVQLKTPAETASEWTWP